MSRSTHHRSNGLDIHLQPVGVLPSTCAHWRVDGACDLGHRPRLLCLGLVSLAKAPYEQRNDSSDQENPSDGECSENVQ